MPFFIFFRDEEETLKKFNNFLDYCKNYIEEMIAKSNNQNQIEEIFGECSDVLNSLLDYLNKFDFFIYFLKKWVTRLIFS